jgi:hypothetical protein
MRAASPTRSARHHVGHLALANAAFAERAGDQVQVRGEEHALLRLHLDGAQRQLAEQHLHAPRVPRPVAIARVGQRLLGGGQRQDHRRVEHAG